MRFKRQRVPGTAAAAANPGTAPAGAQRPGATPARASDPRPGSPATAKVTARFRTEQPREALPGFAAAHSRPQLRPH